MASSTCPGGIVQAYQIGASSVPAMCVGSETNQISFVCQRAKEELSTSSTCVGSETNRVSSMCQREEAELSTSSTSASVDQNSYLPRLLRSNPVSGSFLRELPQPLFVFLLMCHVPCVQASWLIGFLPDLTTGWGKKKCCCHVSSDRLCILRLET